MQGAKIIELETERLLLRQWIAADGEPFALMNADPRVMEFYPALLDRAGSDALLERMQQLIAERGWGFWALQRKSDGHFIGFTGLHTPSHDLPFAPCVEIGWRLGFPHWGSGYASEAARAALQLAFNRLHMGEIVAFTALANRRSRAVMERLGMENTRQNFLHPHVPEESGLKEHCLYRINRNRWKNLSTG